MEIHAEESGFERAHIPEGIHHAELVGISDAPDGQYGPRVALDFRVYYSKSEQPVQIGRVFGKKLTPKSKLWEAFEALTPDIKVGTKVETDTLIGKPCRVVVEDMSDHEGKTISVISRVKAPDEDTPAFLASAKKAQASPVSVEEICGLGLSHILGNPSLDPRGPGFNSLIKLLFSGCLLAAVIWIIRRG